MYSVEVMWEREKTDPDPRKEAKYFDVVYETHEKLEDAIKALNIFMAGWIMKKKEGDPLPYAIFVEDGKGEIIIAYGQDDGSEEI